ncbi:high nitrogen upregulated cytochrome P450 monooxygenase 2 [Mycena galopus ATCC 62051]|nr:high nitrogen upregulated cytochrome P450 monooxygenase 2 [Mycena galopus ATCC 62051]
MLQQFNGSEASWIPYAIILGLINHVYFNRFEPKSASGPLVALIVQPLLLLFILGVPFSHIHVLSAYIVFISTLCSSIAIYRISPWHPLAHIPGPTMHKITKFWSVWICSGGDQHIVNKRLHDQYGPFLRTGPNEVSIIHVDAVKAVLGTGGFQKGQCERHLFSGHYEPRSDPNLPETFSLLSLRGEPHANRRRIWNRGLSSESLNEYESILAKRVAQLVERLEGLSGAVDIAEWFSYFTFDFMGDMAFGGGFEMLRDGGDKDGLWTIIENGAKSLALVAHIPWLAPTLYLIPTATQGLRKLRKFGATCAGNRIKTGSKVKDLFFHLIDEAGMEKRKPTFAEVVADGVLSIIAGSDTTSIAVSSFVWFILRHPDIYRRVQDEVDSVYPDGESLLDTFKHDELRFLTACLNETMRLHPPVPTNGTRQVPRGGGRLIAGRQVHTHIYIPPYSLHRSAEYFSRSPDKFDPDRWLRQEKGSDEVLNMAAFIPFSYGAANCVGKSLAWREMLMVTSTLLKKFNLRFADGFDSENWLNNLQDVFVTSIGGPLLVEISRR